MKRLPELREKITQISPHLRENIEFHEHNKQEIRIMRYSRANMVPKNDEFVTPTAASRKELSPDGTPLPQDSDQDLQVELQMLSNHINQKSKEKEIEGFISEFLSCSKPDSSQ
jgi:hypothetical protein